MRSFYLTDSGKVRDHNEDSVVVVKNGSSENLMIVADGMGGHSAGEIASNIVVSHLGKSFSNLDTIGDKEGAINWLRENVNAVNAKIFEYTSEHPESAGMGTTIVCAIKTDEYILIGNIGDSSGYVLKDEELHKVTYDHTLVNLLVATGELTEEEARMHPKKNVLMKALGANDPIEMDIYDVDQDVDAIMLCSDGLTTMLNDEQIVRILNSEEEIEEKIIKLIGKCNNRGGTDNISIAYLENKEGEK